MHAARLLHLRSNNREVEVRVNRESRFRVSYNWISMPVRDVKVGSPVSGFQNVAIRIKNIRE